MLDTLVDLATSREFLAGASGGLLSAFIGLVVGAWWRHHNRTPAPIAGVLLAVATLTTLPVAHAVPLNVWVGVMLLAGAGFAVSSVNCTGAKAAITAFASIPGAAVIGFLGGSPGIWWIRWLVVGGIVAAGPLVANFDGQYRTRAWGPPLFAISVLGLLFTVPDTEEALVLTGVALPLALIGGPSRLVGLGSTGSMMAVGVFLWITVLGGLGRPGSMVGAAASLGLLMAEPLARLSTGHSSLEALRRPWPGAVAVGIFQVGVVFITSRVAGLQDDPILAAVIATIGLGLAIAVLLMAPRSSLTTLSDQLGREKP